MKVISKIIQWFLAIVLVVFAMTTGSTAGAIMFVAAILMAPIKPIRRLLSKIKIKSFVAIALSIILFFVGMSMEISPSTDALVDDELEDNFLIEDNTTSNYYEDIVESTTETNTELITEETESVIVITTEEETKQSTTESTTLETTTQKETTTNKETTTSRKETTTKNETTTKKTETTTKRETTTVDPDSQVTVYYTKSGSKYHYENPCGNGTYYPSTLARAKARGLTPCNKCVY